MNGFESGIVFYASIASFTASFILTEGQIKLPKVDKFGLVLASILLGIVWPVSLGYYIAYHLDHQNKQ